MFTKVASLIAVLALSPHSIAQDPARDGQRGARSFAAALPDSTLLVANLAEVGPQLEALRGTVLFRLVRALPVAPEAHAALARFTAVARQLTGLDDDQLFALLRHGVTVALTRVDEQDRPHVVLSARLTGDVSVYASALENAAEGAGLTHAGVHRGATIWRLEVPHAVQPAVCVHRNRLILATDAADLEDVLDRLEDGAASLADHPRYREFATRSTVDGAPLFSCFIQTDALSSEILRRMTDPAVRPLRAYLEALGLQRVRSIGYTAHVNDGGFVDHVRLHFPEPREGVLGALLGPGTALDSAAITRLVPPDVTAFSVAQIGLHRIFDETMKLIESVDTDAAGMFRGTLATLASRTGVDIEQDILRSLGEQMVTLQWSGEGSSLDVAVLIEVIDPWRLEQSLVRLTGSLGLPARDRSWRGHTIHELGLGGAGESFSPGFAVSKSHVVFALSGDAMRSTLTQMDTPAESPDALAFLSRLPADTTSASWTALGPMARGLLEQLRESDSTPPRALAVLESTLQNLSGDMETRVSVDPAGVSIHTTSPAGNLYAVAAAVVVASIALPDLVAQDPQTALIAHAEPPPELFTLLLDIERHQRLRLDAEPGAAHADLDELVRGGHLSAATLGEPLGDGVYRVGRYLVTVLLPESPVERRQLFAAIAWPDGEQRGSLLAITTDQPLLINEAIASSAGIRRVEPTDLFLSGRFGTALVPGWREAPKPTRTPVTGKAKGSPDQAQMDAILAAEAAGTTPAPQEVLDGLRSTNPLIAARAAYALGLLGATESVPKLCETIDSYPNLEVRRQAMAAVRKLSDPRSIQASLRALESEDPVLRKLAAANLAKLRAPDATDALLGVVTAEDSTDGSDQVAALLALTDLGAHEAMLPAATAVTEAKSETGVALTYLFQTLSPQLPPERETVVLMAVLAHPCVMLRRYAIQRLGQLEDRAAVTALEGRLASEDDPALRPLIEVSLQAIRGKSAAIDDGTGEPAWAPLVAAWQRLRPEHRAMVGAGGVGVVVLVGGLLLWRARRRRRAASEQWASMAAPSEGFEDHVAVEDHEHYDDEAYEDHDYEGEYDEGFGGAEYFEDDSYEEATVHVDDTLESWEQDEAGGRRM